MTIGEQIDGFLHNYADYSIDDLVVKRMNTVTIEDTDNAATEQGPTVGTMTVRRTGNREEDLTVFYSVSGTATAGSDYQTLSGSVVILANQDSATITVAPIDDTVTGEGNETVVVTLTADGTYIVGAQNSATVTIIDDDIPAAGSLQLSSGAYSVNESGGTAFITVTRTGGSSGVVSVTITTANGTATAGSDYTVVNQTVIFASGDTTSKTVSVPIISDGTFEGNETVGITLSAPTGGAVLGSPSSAVLTIIDDDPAPAGTLQFSAGSYSVNENGGSATITITRMGGSIGAVGVTVTTSDGTAQAGSDYTAINQVVSFGNGDTASKTVNIPVTNDSSLEGDETVNLTLSNPTGGAGLGSPNTAVLTIVDDELPPPAGSLQFSASSYSVNENGGSVTITITRTGGSSGAVGVTFSTSNGTATVGSDYAAASQTVSFGNGDTINKVVNVPIINDTVFEGNETVNLTLSSPTGGASLGSPSAAVLTIIDDDPQPLIFVSINDVSVSEGNSGTTNAVFTVTLSFASSQLVTVNYNMANGTAVAGSDYTAQAGTLTFNPGQTAKQIIVQVIGDTIAEADETFFVNLTAATNAIIATGQGVGTIIDDDGPRIITVNCPHDSLQAAMASGSPGDMISVTGTCNENVLVRNDQVRLFLDGGGTAVIDGSDPTRPVIDVRGKAGSIQGFIITGGSSGIEVQRGANAVINNNVIQNTGGSGIVVNQLAFAVLTNNTIQNNAGDGILVKGAAAARIGFNSGNEPSLLPNTIQMNSGNGITIAGSSSARVVGSNIDNNGGHGVGVMSGAQADLSNNAINNNCGDGINVTQNSAIQLGNDPGLFAAANNGAGNGGFGIGCDFGGALDGLIGSLTGVMGVTSIDPSCANSLSP